MKTGIESLDAGAPDITYTGNEGPKSPREMAFNKEFIIDSNRDNLSNQFYGKDYDELNEEEIIEIDTMMENMDLTKGSKGQGGIGNMASMEAGQEGTLEEIYFELIEMGMNPEDAAIKAREIYNDMSSKGQGGIDNIAMKSGLIDEYRNYKMGQEDAGEQFMSPRDYYRSQEQDRMGVKDGGGIMRTGFQGGGRDASQADFGGNQGEGASSNRERGIMAQYQGPQGTTGQIAPVDRSNDIQDQNQRAVVAAAIAENKKIAEQKELEKERRAELTLREKLNEYNKNYKEKQKQRYAFLKINELNKKLGNVGVDYFGDTEETYGDIIGANAPSITDFGPKETGGTGKYSQEFINDVLSGKRAPPESFAKINSQYPSFAAMAANIIGPKLGGPTTKEELMDIYSGNKTGNSYIGARDFDIEQSTGKKMMEIFEPNRYAREHRDTGGGDGQGIISQYPIQTAATTPVAEEADAFSVDPIRFASNVPSEHDFSGKYFYGADGGRANYAGGGITDLRQGYFLGKLVKKVTKGIKKVAKSPVGLAALSMFAPQIMGKFIPGMANTGWKGNFLSKLGTSVKGNPFPWIAGASALGGLYTAMNPEDEEDGYDYGEKDKWLKYHAGVGDEKNWQSIRFADGGRTGYAGGKDHRAAALSAIYGEDEDEDNMYNFAYGGSAGMPPVSIAPEGFNSQSFPDDETTGIAQATPQNPMPMPMAPQMDPRMMQMAQMDPRRMAQQGMPRRMAAEGGLMDMGGMEKDYRAEGGFVPLGGEERADDVPARLSKNEFVFTADAVRNAGGGDIDKGAEVMENLMDNLEQGGQVSQGSQGLEGAREMFQTQQRLGEVL